MTYPKMMGESDVRSVLEFLILVIVVAAVSVGCEASHPDETAPSPESADTAASLTDLAEAHKGKGEYQKALPLHQQALEIREKQLGPEHPDTATSLNNLAELYRLMEDYPKALPL